MIFFRVSLRFFYASFLILFALMITACATTHNQLTQQPRVQRFINKMVVQHHFSRSALEYDFSQVKIRQASRKSVHAPQESNPWFTYERLFVTPAHIRDGALFYRRHAATLAMAQQQYGVPSNVITAIIGVETRYGQHQGQFKVLDALATLAFYYPPRAAYFESELENFFLLTRDMHINPNSVRGSYAGAIGQPQFMPSSYRRFAIDSNHKGHSDLIHNTNDAIMSVANYFRHFGWQTGSPVVVRARIINAARYAKLPKQGYAPKLTLAQLRAYGLTPTRPLPRGTYATVIELQGHHGKEVWLGLKNFYVITRYNNSALYAMAVNELSQKIQERLTQ